MKSNNREIVIQEISDVFWEEGVTFHSSMLGEPTMSLGVDSLAYAILVARLEQKLGIDPFTSNPDAGYPETLGDFVAAYEEAV